MAVKEQTTALIATFADRRSADRFVAELKRAGFQDEEIGLVALHDEQPSHVGGGAAAGALGGGALGACAGALATGLIPGIGPAIAGGLLIGIVGGAATGAAAGGVLGALIGLGVPEDEARQYHEEFLAGRTVVVVQAISRGGDALLILDRCSTKRHADRRDELAGVSPLP